LEEKKNAKGGGCKKKMGRKDGFLADEHLACIGKSGPFSIMRCAQKRGSEAGIEDRVKVLVEGN